MRTVRKAKAKRAHDTFSSDENYVPKEPDVQSTDLHTATKKRRTYITMSEGRPVLGFLAAGQRDFRYDKVRAIIEKLATDMSITHKRKAGEEKWNEFLLAVMQTLQEFEVEPDPETSENYVRKCIDALAIDALRKQVTTLKQEAANERMMSDILANKQQNRIRGNIGNTGEVLQYNTHKDVSVHEHSPEDDSTMYIAQQRANRQERAEKRAFRKVEERVVETVPIRDGKYEHFENQVFDLITPEPTPEASAYKSSDSPSPRFGAPATPIIKCTENHEDITIEEPTLSEVDPAYNSMDDDTLMHQLSAGLNLLKQKKRGWGHCGEESFIGPSSEGTNLGRSTCSVSIYKYIKFQ